jgi:hypothetical protein
MAQDIIDEPVVTPTTKADPLAAVRVEIDTSEEKFGSEVTIAHLAQHSFNGRDSDLLHIYEVVRILERDWRDEIEGTEMEYLTGVTATFKDGSQLSIAAWADCCEDKRCKHCVG